MNKPEQLTLADAKRESFYGCFPAGYGRPWLTGDAAGEPDPGTIDDELEHQEKATT